jgi:hypothetical protein
MGAIRLFRHHQQSDAPLSSSQMVAMRLSRHYLGVAWLKARRRRGGRPGPLCWEGIPVMPIYLTIDLPNQD